MIGLVLVTVCNDTREIHVQPLTIKFITTAVSSVCEFEIEFGKFTLNCTMLMGYETILNTVEGFYWFFLIAIICRWVLLASRVCSCYWTLLGMTVSFVREGNNERIGK